MYYQTASIQSHALGLVTVQIRYTSVRLAITYPKYTIMFARNALKMQNAMGNRFSVKLIMKSSIVSAHLKTLLLTIFVKAAI